MKVTFQAVDGESFNTQKECLEHERRIKNHQRLETLVENEVAYFDNQQTVLHFIEDNKKELLEILKKLV
jgi:hypothetical protein